MKTTGICSYCEVETSLLKFMGDEMCSACKEELAQTDKRMTAHHKEIREVYKRPMIEVLELICGSTANSISTKISDYIVTTTGRDGVYTHKHIRKT